MVISYLLSRACVRALLRSKCKYCAGHFFFFKQKTAYELRISDWSSDVCSSDLSMNFKHKISRQRPYGKAEAGLRASDGSLDAVLDQLESDRGRIINSAAVRSRLTHSLEVQQTEIGRAHV